MFALCYFCALKLARETLLRDMIRWGLREPLGQERGRGQRREGLLAEADGLLAELREEASCARAGVDLLEAEARVGSQVEELGAQCQAIPLISTTTRVRLQLPLSLQPRPRPRLQL